MFIEKQIQSANFNLSMNPTNKNNWILTSPPSHEFVFNFIL